MLALIPHRLGSVEESKNLMNQTQPLAELCSAREWPKKRFKFTISNQQFFVFEIQVLPSHRQNSRDSFVSDCRVKKCFIVLALGIRVWPIFANERGFF